MALETEAIVGELILRIEGYRQRAREAIAINQELRKSIQSAGGDGAALEQAGARQIATRKKVSDAEKAEAKSARDAVKAAAKEKSDAERAAAKLAADAVKASEKEKADALKATVAEQEKATKAAEARARAEEAASARIVAAAEREAAANARRAEVVDRALARRASQVAPSTATGPRLSAEGERSAVARQSAILGQTRVPSAAAPEAAAEVEVNHALADRYDLSQRARVASKEDAADLRAQVEEINRFNTYKRAGLTDAEALVRIDREAVVIEQQRARIAAEQAVIVEKQLRAQQGAIASKFSAGAGVAGALVGGLGLAEVSHLNDKYIELSNSLKVAGVSASEFDQVQGHLLATANRNGTDLNALADVFRSASLGAHDLGLSQADLLKITDAASNSLRIQGVSSEQARGALLQLGHAFESGRVNAREFNSLALNLYPILQAAAAGSDRFGGSVAKLRAEIVAGTVSSKDFAQSIIAGADALQDRAAKATLTTAQGFTSLTNALVVYFGEADKSQGVSAALGAALQKLGANLDTLIPAIAAIGTALTVGYISRMTAAAIATRGLGGAVLGAFGGPVGLAITAVTVGIGALAVEANSAAERGAEASRAYAELQDRLKATAGGASVAGGGIKSVGTDALGAIPHVNAFAGAVGNLAQQLYNQARAARSARVEGLQQQLTAGRAKEAALLGDTPTGRAASAQGLSRGDFLNNIGIIGRNLAGSASSFFSGGRTDREAVAHYGNQIAVNRDIERQLRAAQGAPITPADIPGGGGAANANQPRIDKLQREIDDLKKIEGGTSGKRRASIDRQIERRQQQISALADGATAGAAAAGAYVPGAGRSGPSAATLQHRDDERDKRFSDELAQIHDRHLAAERQLAIGSEAEFAAQEASIKAARDRQNKDYLAQEKLNQIGEGRAKELIAQNDAVAQEELKGVALRRQVEAAQRVADAADREFALQGELLQTQQAFAKTSRDRLAGALAQIDLDERRTRSDSIRTLFSHDPGVSDRDRIAAGARLRDAGGVADRARLVAREQEKTPGQGYRDALHPTASQKKDIIENVEIDALNRFNEGLDDSIAKTLKLHGLFGDIAKQLIDIAIKRAIIAPIADGLFGGKSGGFSGGGFGKLIGGLLGGLRGGAGGAGAAAGSFDSFAFPGAATGGEFDVGGNPGIDRNLLSINGEGRVRVSADEKVTIGPKNIGAANGKVAAPSSQVTVVAPLKLDLRNAVMTPELVGQLNQMSEAHARNYAVAAGTEAVRQANASAPAAVRRYQTLKG